MVLLIEDDALSRTSFAETLLGFGYDALEAGDAAEALALVTKHQAVRVDHCRAATLPANESIVRSQILSSCAGSFRSCGSRWGSDPSSAVVFSRTMSRCLPELSG